MWFWDYVEVAMVGLAFIYAFIVIADPGLAHNIFLFVSSTALLGLELVLGFLLAAFNTVQSALQFLMELLG